ncbi:hypothetical protein BJV78DRAFT_367038 [Lactifluus subvellereus]|nr:hypothetical protein BJV78DRAFT_367038 [Lactifluus subvellereus]
MPPPENVDQAEDEVDALLPLGFKLTWYRLLNMVVLFAFGLAKSILWWQGHSNAPTGLEWASGPMLACLSYWIGLYETVEPPKWE